MPKPRPVCPFTDSSCTGCRALFTAAPGAKPVPKMRGCQLLDDGKNRQPLDVGALP